MKICVLIKQVASEDSSLVLNNDNLISGFSLGLGMDYGYFNIDLKF